MKRQFIKQGNDKAVILPFYGEFGWFLTSHVRLVHYLDVSDKIVCCRKGEEIYFPSANSFFYEWKDLFEDAEKCGFRNTWPINPIFRETVEEKALSTRLSGLYPEHELLEFCYAIPPEMVQYFPVPIKVNRKYGLKPDVVICARRRYTNGDFGDGGERNYKHWPRVVGSLVKKGYQVGIIGRRDTSCDLSRVQCRSWEYEDSVGAMLEMLSGARLFIGTDTGPTHLAAILRTPMILFRNGHEKLSPDMLRRCVVPIARRQGFYAQIVSDGWDDPSEVVSAAFEYLDSSSMPRGA